MSKSTKPRVVVVGAGFAGLWAVRTLAREPVDIVVIDRNNYHTFLALLYQVAAAELEPEDIAYPIRSIFRDFPNVEFALAYVHRVDLEKCIVATDGKNISYDYLILATGSIPHSFGVMGVERHAFFLKTLEEGVILKNHIICCFERADRQVEGAVNKGALTFVIVGGGATGVEYAGALSELVHGPMIREYRNVDFTAVRIILLESANTLVNNMPESIRSYTLRRLRKMGVEVCLQKKVIEVTQESVLLNDQERIPTQTVVWTAGVRGEALPSLSNIVTSQDGRVPVLPTLQISGYPHVYVVGDLARIESNNRSLPMVAQVAIQSAVAAAQNIGRQIGGSEPLPFHYNDLGSMIAIGRNAAGVSLGSKNYSGFFAWLLWLVIHLFNLIGFRNRVMVVINWAWDYLLYERAVRFVFPPEMPSHAKSSSCSTRSEGSEIRNEEYKVDAGRSRDDHCQ